MGTTSFDLHPQPSAYPDILGDLLKYASFSLRDGTWKRHIDAALDLKIAGENVNRDMLLYSGISSVLPGKLHVLAQGTSQYGKSYLERKVGEMLFPDCFEDISSLSSKALYFECREKSNPRLYADKIAFVDELADAPEIVQNFLKAATSQGVDRLNLKTVEDMKYLPATIDGLPVFWSSTFQIPEKDKGNQLLNRFFLISIDESEEQNRRVDELQAHAAAFGVEEDPPAIMAARNIVAEILRNEKEGRKPIVLNPFAPFVKTCANGGRNRRPMLEALIAAIAYANRFTRPCFEDDKRRIVLASRGDVQEAMRLWSVNERAQQLKIPPHLRTFLEVFEGPDDWLTPDEAATRYSIGRDRPISSDSAYTYLHELAGRDIITSHRRRDSFGEETRRFEFAPLAGSLTNSRTFELDSVSCTTDVLAKVVEREIPASLTDFGINEDRGDPVAIALRLRSC
jgi:hypothetical protein